MIVGRSSVGTPFFLVQSRAVEKGNSAKFSGADHGNALLRNRNCVLPLVWRPPCGFLRPDYRPTNPTRVQREHPWHHAGDVTKSITIATGVLVEWTRRPWSSQCPQQSCIRRSFSWDYSKDLALQLNHLLIRLVAGRQGFEPRFHGSEPEYHDFARGRTPLRNAAA